MDRKVYKVKYGRGKEYLIVLNLPQKVRVQVKNSKKKECKVDA
ncbi:MAG: hypothetical protein Q8P86_03520 [bacterium]|nr:hypothetical protein [bacterium]